MSFLLDTVCIDVVSDIAKSAQDTAQRKLDNALLDAVKAGKAAIAAKIAKMRDASDGASILSLSAILQEVYNTTICLMRLSRPLLSNHLHHQKTTPRCDQDDKHHVEDLQRLLPRATLTTLKRLSKSICARRLQLLRMNSHPGEFGQALEDVIFLRMVLLDLASVSDEAVNYESSTSSSDQTDPGRLGVQPSSFEDVENMESSLAGRPAPNIGQMETIPTSLEYMLKNIEPAPISTAQRREDIDSKTKLDIGPKAKQASFADHESSDDSSEVFTVTVCTRCRLVRLTRR